MNKLIDWLHRSGLLGRIFHTLDNCLQQELKDCETVLDIGCGPSSPLQYCKNIKYSVGVEVFKQYLDVSKKKKIHNKYFNKKIEGLDFKKDEFDAVIMTEVLEHFDEKVGMSVLKKAKKWASKKIVISSPNGFIEQKAVDGNPFQKHKSGWDLNKMKGLGFDCHGLAGLKWLRKPVENESMDDDLLTSIRFYPKFFWFMVATISQLITFYFPRLAFELFCVKKNAN